MIDTHTHLLPGVDDGVKTYEESLKIIRQLEKNGVRKILLTPHYAPLRGFKKTQDELASAMRELKEVLYEANVEVDLYLGSEIDYSKHIYEDIAKAPSLNGTSALLIDFGTGDPDIEEAVYELMIRGYTVIIAHPERYRNVTLATWKRIRRQGGVLQVSAGHLVGKGSKNAQKMTKQFLKNDMIDLVASDLHDSGEIESMRKAFKKIEKKKGFSVADQLFDKRPGMLIRGKDE